MVAQASGAIRLQGMFSIMGILGFGLRGRGRSRQRDLLLVMMVEPIGLRGGALDLQSSRHGLGRSGPGFLAGSLEMASVQAQRIPA